MTKKIINCADIETHMGTLSRKNNTEQNVASKLKPSSDGTLADRHVSLQISSVQSETQM